MTYLISSYVISLGTGWSTFVEWGWEIAIGEGASGADPPIQSEITALPQWKICK